MTLRLYDYILSGSCYKVRLFCALLKIEYEAAPVDFYPGNEHKSEPFLDINPAGTIPVLTDCDLVLCDSISILSYLARKYDASEKWLPVNDAQQFAEVIEWMNFSAILTETSGVARLHDMLGRSADIERVRQAAKTALRRLESRLTEQGFFGNGFLVGDRPTIADIACFPYAALAPDGGIALDDYPAINRWMLTIRKLDHFLEMPGIHPLHESPGKPLQKAGTSSQHAHV